MPVYFDWIFSKKQKARCIHLAIIKYMYILINCSSSSRLLSTCFHKYPGKATGFICGLISSACLLMPRHTGKWRLLFKRVIISYKTLQTQNDSKNNIKSIFFRLTFKDNFNSLEPYENCKPIQLTNKYTLFVEDSLSKRRPAVSVLTETLIEPATTLIFFLFKIIFTWVMYIILEDLALHSLLCLFNEAG